MNDQINVVGRDEWLKARKLLLEKEKAFTRMRDKFSSEIRNLPWVKLEENYQFKGESGTVLLSDLFGDRRQLIIYHFMLGPDWEEGCKSCSLLMDHFSPLVIHLNHRDVSFAAVSRSSIDRINTFKKRMGWDVNWVSSLGTQFNEDFQVSITDQNESSAIYNYEPCSASKDSELPGLSVFVKGEEGDLYHTYSNYGRGLESFMGIYRLLDVVPSGRDEDDLPYGMDWVRHHDRYGAIVGHGCCGCQ